MFPPFPPSARRALCRARLVAEMPRLLLLLLLGLAARRSAGEKVEAVVFLHDDDVHTFQDVSMALEQLGLLPADALVVTQEVREHCAAARLVLTPID